MHSFARLHRTLSRAVLQNASAPGADATSAASVQTFTTILIYDVYAAYASMAGDLARIDLGPAAAQTAPYDAVAAIDTAGAKAAWMRCMYTAALTDR